MSRLQGFIRGVVITENQVYAIWRCDKKDYMREAGNGAALFFTTKRAACRRAAREYGFATYTEAKRKGWCEVRLLTPFKAKQ